MRTSSLLWTSLFSFSPAWANRPTISISSEWGAIGPGGGSGPWHYDEGFEKGEEAARHPNATNAVTFNRTFDNKPETWTWRINITELAVPNVSWQFGNASANSSLNHHVVNTQWQLQWLGSNASETFRDFLHSRNMTASFGAYIARKPANITDRYDASANGDCTALLGKQCVESLQSTASSRDSPSFINQAGCEDTLDYRYGTNAYNNAVAWSLSGDPRNSSTSASSNSSSNSNASNEDDVYRIFRNGTSYYQTSPYFDAGNKTMLEYTEGTLQVLIMNLKPKIVETGLVSDASDRPVVLCQIVEKGAGEPAGSGAAGWRLSMGAVWAVAVLSSLAVMW